MRVLYVNHTAEVSGGERSLLGLLATFGTDADVQATVACPVGELSRAVERLAIPTRKILGTAGSMRLHPLHTPRTLLELGAAAAQVRRAARRTDVDLVHANSIRAGLALGLGRPSSARVVHVRDCLPAGALSTATMRVIAAGGTTVIANSHYTAETVRRSVPGATVEVVHNAVDLDRWDRTKVDDAGTRAGLGRAGERAVLLGVVAQLSPWKGQDVAVEALRLIVQEGVDAHLLLIGSAKFLASATRFDNQAYVAALKRRIADAGLQERVSWLGERDDVPDLVAVLDVLMLPSREEPFGRAMIEAMAMEVPVLATNVGGPGEIITDGREGFLLSPRDPAAWADAVGRILGDRDGALAMGYAGRLRVEQAFTAGQHAAAVLAVYRRTLTRASA